MIVTAMQYFLGAGRVAVTVATLGISCFATVAAAQSPAFSDVPSTHPAYAAVEYLKAQGFVSGYEDGTFRPNATVNRAEAIKFIMAPGTPQEALAAFTSSPFSDVQQGAWFLPFVEAAREKGVIDGPPKKEAFNGANPVIKAEFIKMLLLGNGVDAASAYSEIQLPLSSDVANTEEWFYPYVRYAITSSMTMIGQDGLLQPGRQLTRSDTAILLHRYLMYKEGRRTQALLSEAETEIIVVLNMLETNNIEQAEFASARALLAARGAHASRPDEPVAQGALKITEAFRSLVRGYRAGINKDYTTTVTLAKEAWNQAARAMELSPALQQIGTQVQEVATTMAASAREQGGQG